MNFSQKILENAQNLIKPSIGNWERNLLKRSLSFKKIQLNVACMLENSLDILNKY